MTTVAFLGCAHIHTRDFVEMIQPRPDVDVGSVWDHDADRARRIAGELGASQAKSVEDVLADPNITSVVIASETIHHRELVIASARARKHMFVDKPLAIVSEEAYEIARAVEDAGVIFQTGYFRRGDPAVSFMRDEIRAGNLGAITRLRVEIGHAGLLGGWFDDEWRWMADPSQAGFGAFGDVGTHALDLIMWLLDEPAVSKVAATTHNLTGRYSDCDEYGEGLLVLGNGTVASIAASWIDRHTPFSVDISGSFRHASSRMACSTTRANG